MVEGVEGVYKGSVDGVVKYHQQLPFAAGIQNNNANNKTNICRLSVFTHTHTHMRRQVRQTNHDK